MQAPDSIETILARLMPPALSQAAQFEIDAMIDELAGPESENVVGISSGRWLVRVAIGGGIAAAIGAMLAISPVFQGSKAEVALVAPVFSNSGLVLVSESDRIESMTDEGWRESPDGSAMRALRLNAVEENNVRDEETGMEVLISEAREEILLIPISAF